MPKSMDDAKNVCEEKKRRMGKVGRRKKGINICRISNFLTHEREKILSAKEISLSIESLCQHVNRKPHASASVHHEKQMQP